MNVDESSIVDLTENLSRDYEKCFLKRNPFPQMGVTDDTPYFTVDREDVIKKFQYAVADLRKTNDTNLTMLVGEYGSGKSHMLSQFKQSINTQLLNRKDGVIAAYVKNPGDEFKHIVTSMMDNIGLAKLSGLVKDFLSEIIKDDDEVKKYCKEADLEKFLNNNGSIEEVIDQSQVINIVKIIHKKKFQKIDNPDIVSAFLNLAHPEFSSISWKWFIGEKLDSGEQKQTNIKIQISSENSKKIFFGYINRI